MIEVEKLSFRYIGRRRPALQHVSWRIQPGEAWLVLGPSGCGKSTLALCLNGAIPHAVEGEMSGRVVVDGLDTRQASMAELAQRVGVVFQDPEAQFCMLTVEDEVAFGLENLAVPRWEMDGRIDQALAAVGLADHRRERIERLSGGQKQRLALACVLAQRPAMLVLDEPTAQLDPAGAAEVVKLLARLKASGQYGLVIIEHRLDELMHLIDRILVLNRAGEVVASGPPRQVMRAHAAWLAEAGVWIPQVTELALELERHGLSLDPLPLTVPEAVAALRPLLAGSRLSLTGPEAGPAEATSQQPPLVRVERLSHRYPAAARAALSDVSFTLAPGEFVALIGANGAGKSTLARHLVGLLRPPPGRVTVGGEDLLALPPTRLATSIGYVFQYPEHQFVGATVLDDVALGLRLAGLPKAEASALAEAMLDAFGLRHLAAAHPFTLSHGEQRRLSVAAMLVLGQTVLLLDEPTFGQDRANATLLLDKLEELAADGRVIVAITHDMRLVAERAQRVLALAEGQLVFDGAPMALFGQPILLADIQAVPPPLWQVGLQLGLSQPPARLADLVGLCLGAAGAVEGVA